MAKTPPVVHHIHHRCPKCFTPDATEACPIIDEELLKSLHTLIATPLAKEYPDDREPGWRWRRLKTYGLGAAVVIASAAAGYGVRALVQPRVTLIGIVPGDD
jgi:hypothetical protein